MTQVINQITLLTVILTGAALIREREQGSRASSGHAGRTGRNHAGEDVREGLVILVAAMLSLQFVDAGKKIKGRKRHILVDTMGLLLNVVVHSADIQGRDGAVDLLCRARRRT